jgi:hypothetical protein
MTLFSSKARCISLPCVVDVVAFGKCSSSVP